MRYHSKVFENDHYSTIEKAKKWAAANLNTKWDWCLMVIDNGVKCVIEWYE